MKRRNFLGLAGQSLALVAAAPALAPLATAAPARHWRKQLPNEHAIQAMTRDLLAKAEVHSHPPLVFSNDGRRVWLHSTIEHLNNQIAEDVVRELRLSTPYDLSSATCEPGHIIDEVV